MEVDPRWFGTDATAAIIAAASGGGRVQIPDGTWNLDAPIVIGDDYKITLSGNGNKTIIKKMFNGDMISLGLDSKVDNIYLDGNGANYTGRGVIVPSGTLGTGRQKILNTTIWNTASYCVEYTNAIAGWMGSMNTCELRRYGDALPCIKFPDSESNGNRALINVNAGHGPLVDFAGCNNATVVGCTAGGAAGVGSFLVKDTNDAQKIIASANRFASGAYDTTIYGVSHSFGNNVWAGPVILGTGSANIDFQDDLTAFGLTDLGTGNQIFTRNAAYSCVWTGSVSNPAIVDGSLNSSYIQSGRIIFLSLEMTMGPNTTMGSGYWLWSLPVPALAGRSQTGAAVMYDSTGNPTSGTVLITDADPNNLKIYISGADYAGSSKPYTWAENDRVIASISYIA